MPQGQVKRYERNAGYGFIEAGEGDLFVHHTGLKDREFLLEGQQVEFDVEAGERGPRAVNVRVTAEVAPKRKNHPDWRGHRGSAPRFEEQGRVLPGGRGRPTTSRAPRRPGSTSSPASGAATHLGPPRDAGDDEAEVANTRSAESDES
jgi:CspA family cold shock protein